MVVSGYTLDLYCDKEGCCGGEYKRSETVTTYYHELRSECRAKARRDGWILRQDNTCVCPKCSGKKKK